MDGMIARSIQIEGRVLGVYFREWAVKVAQELDVGGWIGNLQDGRVDVYAVGDETAVERFTRRLHEGSPASDVDKVTAQPAEVIKLHAFLRRETETSGADHRRDRKRPRFENRGLILLGTDDRTKGPPDAGR